MNRTMGSSNTPSLRVCRDQMRTAAALAFWDETVPTAIRNGRGSDKVDEKKLRALLEGAAIFARNSGLIQAVAVWLTSREGRLLAGEVTGWLLSQLSAAPPLAALLREARAPEEQARALVRVCATADRSLYRLLQDEALAYLAHLKLVGKTIPEVARPARNKAEPSGRSGT